MELKRIDPDDLNARQKEIYNYQKSAAILADYGFNCIKLSDDWQGADFLAHHFDGSTTLKVQLKGRLTIDRKYVGTKIWMNFPVDGTWYLVPHEELVCAVGRATNWLNTKSWQEYGGYSSNNPSSDLLEELHPFALNKKPDQAIVELPSHPTKPASNAANKPSALPSGNKWPQSISIRSNLIGRGNVRQFEFNGVRYEVPHDELVRIVGEVTPWLNSPSWINHGGYSTSNPSAELLNRLLPFALNFSG